MNRKVQSNKELFHLNMVAIPFFYSQKPSNVLIVKGISNEILQNSECNIIKKLYYRNNKPILSTIVSFQTIEKAVQFKQGLKKRFESQANKRYICYYCKDISEFVGILFQQNRNYVLFPETKQMKNIIDTISQMIIVDGLQIEQILEKTHNQTLSFLNHHILNLENIYYRWRVYSYLQGDGDKNYRQEPFQMIRNGIFWYPPQLNTNLSYPVILNIHKIVFLSQGLQKMQRRKHAIQELMVLAIHNVASSVHILSIITISLYEKLKQDFIGHLYLISDILFNSTNPTYKNILEGILPHVIYRYVLLKQNDQNKTMSDKILAQLKKILTLWQKKYIFDQNFSSGLIFLLQLISVDKIYQMKRYPQHAKIKDIMENEFYLIQLQRNCNQHGLPFYQQKQEQAKLFLNFLFWSNEQISQTQPQIGKYDGQPLNEKDIINIKVKGQKIITCQGLSGSSLSQKNWKNIKLSSYSVSQDGQN